jgi:hypothetical protein
MRLSMALCSDAFNSGAMLAAGFAGSFDGVGRF